MWSRDGRESSQLASTPGGAEILYEKIQGFSPQNVTQHSLQAQALSIVIDVGKSRWLMFEQGSSSVSLTLLVLIFWFSAIFCSFGLLAPCNATVMATLCLCALSVSAAIFLVRRCIALSPEWFRSPALRCAALSRILKNSVPKPVSKHPIGCSQTATLFSDCLQPKPGKPVKLQQSAIVSALLSRS
jgi:hypothetical protein